ncbi:unnamed protein product [Rotaria sordida]|uniref:Uncharacterized protein n=1 Tax=Rotaria sordida TaxID=392033 RepID=A0A820C7S6_9BILA|nr:unnamed protein product [Rotaria sordida]CAF4213219.1 unnamed protein product [Rotaria sordida]
MEILMLLHLFQLSETLILYICNMIGSNLFSFWPIDRDTTLNTVSKSHTRFVVSVLLTSNSLLKYDDEIRQAAVVVLMNLFDTTDSNGIRRVVAYALA